jgi:hypothetical protein
MRNAYAYVSILLGIAVFLAVVWGVVFYRKRLKFSLRRPRRATPQEDFYCVRSSLKQINGNFYVAQILFTNRKDCSLTTHGETRHQATEE